jgi:hypothetical protein
MIEIKWLYPVFFILILILAVLMFWLVVRGRDGPFANVKVDELDALDGLGARRGGGSRRGGRLRVKDLTKHPRSMSEAEVVRYLEQITGDKFPTAYPKWLSWKGKHLELDGFNGKIALEFSGPLHTKWTPGKEAYTDYFERVVRDVVKRRLCKKHGVKLIVVDASLPSRHWRNYILSRLADFGLVDRPSIYIDEQVAEPYRNEQLEAELGLTNEYIVASRL